MSSPKFSPPKVLGRVDHVVGPEGAALAESVVGAVKALRSELAAAGHVTGVRKARSVAEGLAAACIANPGALAALEAAAGARLSRLLGGPVELRPDGDGRLVVVVRTAAAKAIGCPSGRCHAADVFAAAGRLNGLTPKGGAQ